MIKQLKYILEFIPLKIFHLICNLLSVSKASTFGGSLVGFIGPFLKKSKIAKHQISEVFPELSNQEVNTLVKSMWVNLGRVLGEYSHLKTLANPDNNYIDLKDPHNFIPVVCEGKKTFFFGAHIANWEILQSIMQYKCGKSFTGVYRAPNNPYSRDLLAKMRQTFETFETIPKSSKGSRELIKHMSSGKNIGLLVDQKYNQGMNIPFFGKDAMTSTGFISLCQKYNYTLVSGYVVRKEGCHFEFNMGKPIDLYNKDGSPRSEYEVMCEIHTILEDWTKQNPEQWIWIHRRWGKI